MDTMVINLKLCIFSKLFTEIQDVPSVYKTLPKLGRYNHYKWFKILTRKPKPNYIYVVGMGFAFNAI
jgi:hypothetical protein